ncbi:unnamed protein product [Clonostachys solani]|uniref:Uncharacterized protein n=1 Tax=Clonostachys solani TaxID=160281 RepID=A0A9N9VXW5_9HYPO|nr:unnamed protein product [Clonostachys solani]
MRLFGILAVLVSLASCFTNPIRRPTGSDPFITWSGDGYYYLLTTTWTTVEIARATTIDGLKSASRKVIYQSLESSRCCNVWAPEVHWLGDRWYVYFTAGNGNNLDGQRMHVLRGGTTPWDSYTYVGRIGPDQWNIDGSILRTSGFGNFFVSSCFNGATYQSICIQALGSDYVSTTTGSVSLISQPTQSWERVSHPVNEGPAALYFGGKTYLGYSASYCWSGSYCVGLLTWDGVTNPTSAGAWTKSSGCVLSSANSNYGTGHNSFFQSPNGQETWMAFHATSTSGGACDDTRYTMVQPLSANSNGSPNFGTPASFSTSFNEPSK